MLAISLENPKQPKPLSQFSHNARITEVERDLWRMPRSTPLLKVGTTRKGCRGPCPVRFWISQGWRLHSLFGQHVCFALSNNITGGKGCSQNQGKYSYKISSRLKKTDQESQQILFLRAQFVFCTHNTTLQRLPGCDLSMHDSTKQLISCPSSYTAYLYLCIHTNTSAYTHFFLYHILHLQNK